MYCERMEYQFYGVTSLQRAPYHVSEQPWWDEEDTLTDRNSGTTDKLFNYVYNYLLYYTIMELN